MRKVYMVYLLANRKNGAIYCGVTGDPEGRIWEHKNEWYEGFTKRYGIKTLVWYEFHEDVGEAIWREKKIKEWRRAWKIRLIEMRNPDWYDLYHEITGTR